MHSVSGIRLSLLRFIFIGLATHLSCAQRSHGQGLQMEDKCTDTQRAYHLKGFNGSAPSTAVPGSELHICKAEYSCCTADMEETLQTQSIKQFENKIHDLNSKLEGAFQEKHKKFNDFFVALIENARKSSDSLFYRTYGELYSVNSEVFMELFQELKSYYKGSSVDVGEIFDNFFTAAMQKVFKLVHNRKYIFDDEYMECISEHVNTIQPFKTFPALLSGQVQRTFTVARTFVNGLEAGKLLSGTLAKYQATPECSKAIMKMSQCGLCQGVLTVKPCHDMCMNVMKGCLCDFSDFSVAWNDYMDAMQMLLNRLDGPFNIESFLDPFDVKLSGAIMLLQDNKGEITRRVFGICGEPKKNPNYTFTDDGFDRDLMQDLQDPSHPSYTDTTIYEFGGDLDYHKSTSREKRSAEESEDISSPSASRKRSRRLRKKRRDRKERHLDKSGHKNTKKVDIAQRHRSMLHPWSMEGSSRYQYNEEKDALEKKKHSSLPTALGTNLSELVSEMRKMMTMARNYWSGLAGHICSEESSKDTPCWNGESAGSYQSRVVGDGSQHQRSNPEVAFDVEYTPSSSVQDEMSRIRQIVNQLKTAYKGFDPRRGDDDDDTNFGFSGEGSAEGSGGAMGDTIPRDNADTSKFSNTCPDCGGASTISYSISSMIIAFFWTVRLVL